MKTRKKAKPSPPLVQARIDRALTAIANRPPRTPKQAAALGAVIAFVAVKAKKGDEVKP